MDEKTSDHLPLTRAQLHILLALAEGERHGYAIIKEIEEMTEGDVSLLPGTLYRLIKQMCIDEWIVEAKRPETREKRIATALDWIAEGKQRNWKYQK